MAACVALLVALATVTGGDRPALIALGGDPARGVLVNFTPGARPGEGPDPARPSVVFIHGFNLAPRIVHFTMAERLAEAVARRGGPPAFNVLGWDWNAATFAGLSSAANETRAVVQGQALAATLIGAGLPPERVHLVGHSSGGIVAASAARTFLHGCGRRVAQLTLLDPAALYHDLIFDVLGAGTCAARVENDWSPGPSGYGRPVARAGVWNTRVDGPTPYLGTVCPSRSSHFHVVSWYIATAGEPCYPGGFNTSLLLAGLGP